MVDTVPIEFEAISQRYFAACEVGRIAPRPAKPLAHFVFGALCETAMTVAGSDDRSAARGAARAEISRILDAAAVSTAQ